jgi:hypothetical protein
MSGVLDGSVFASGQDSTVVLTVSHRRGHG